MKDKKETKKKDGSEKDSASSCCYIVHDPCGCYVVDRCGCYVDPCCC
ncbi:MAG: hypothetical protein KJO26_11265 [Deltaproteobacteria bacterium]|nr:hypothetical protein [Deltaproteobacteria bacterium]